MKLSQASRFDDLKSVGPLPSPGGIALEIMRLSRRDDVGAAELAHVVQADPALSGRLIHLANSAAAGQHRAVSSVGDAVTRVGLRALWQAALGFSLLAANRAGNCLAFDYDAFWARSLAMGIASQSLSRHFRSAPAEECFALGLLADVGRLTLATLYPVPYARLLDETALAPSLLLERERAAFAMDHAEVGAAMLEEWGFPEVFAAAVLHYANPGAFTADGDERTAGIAACLQLAAGAADYCVAAPAQRAACAGALRRAATAHGIGAQALEDDLAAIVSSWRQWGRLLTIPTSDVPALAAVDESAPAAAAATSPTSERLRILVAESPAASSPICTLLGAAGYAAHRAGSADQVLQHIVSAPPDVVLIDWPGPAAEGLALCRALRESGTGRQLYVILACPGAGEHGETDAFAAGADSCILRPLTAAALQARLQAARRFVELQQAALRGGRALGESAKELAIANRRLVDSENFAKCTLNSVRANICVLDGAGQILAVNHAWRSFHEATNPSDEERRYGAGANYLEVCNRAAMAGVHDAARMAAGIRGVMRGETTVFRMEYPCQYRDEQLWFMASVTRFAGDSGNVVVAHEDITDRKRAERRVVESEQRFRDFTRSSADWFWETDAQLRYCYLSENFEAAFGLSPAEVLGKTREDLYERDPLNPPAQLRAHQAQLARREPFRNFEYYVRTRAGRIACQSVSGVPFYRSDGTFGGYRGVGQDVSERKRLEEAREEALGRLQKIASRIPGVVYQFRMRPDGSSAFPFASEYIRNIYRVSPEEVREDASRVFSVLHPDDLDGVVASIRESARTLSPWRHEYRVRFDDGTVNWLFGDAVPQREEDGSVLWHGYIWDITERKKFDAVIRDLAFHDTLTLLPNRRLLSDRLAQAVGSCKRGKVFGALLIIDLDRFKPINDTHGHAGGDQLLVEVARRLKHSAREIDTVARYGGDEFVVVLKELHADAVRARQLAAVVAERIRADLDAPYRLTRSRHGGAGVDVECRCTASIGGSLFGGEDAGEDELIKRADTQMYLAKAAGGNCVKFS